jgi:hypothetical protein
MEVLLLDAETWDLRIQAYTGRIIYIINCSTHEALTTLPGCIALFS